MTDGPFTSTREDRADRTVLRFTGELDATSADAIRAVTADAMDQAIDRRLVLDLAAVTFLDSSTLGWIVWARDRGRKRNVTVSVMAPTGTRAARVLDLAGFGSVVRVVDSADDRS